MIHYPYPGGGLGISTGRDQQSIFWVLNFDNMYFLGYCSQLLYFLGMLNKSCISECLILSAVFI